MKTFKDQVWEQLDEANSLDTITVDVPLFIRLLEWAREDAKTDVVLHVAAENAVKCHSKGTETLSMAEYGKIVGE